MSLPPTPDYSKAPPLDAETRRDLAKEIWYDVQTISSKVVITVDTHAIQIVVFPPTDTRFTVPGHSPVTGVIRDGLYQEG